MTTPDDSHGASVDDGGRAPVGWGLTLIAVGVLWLLWQLGAPIRLEVVLPAAVIVVGLLLLVGHRWVGAGGLVGVGVVLAVASLLVATVPGPLSLAAGQRHHVVTAADDLEDRYALGAGQLIVDLRDLELPEGTTEVTAQVILGDVQIRVPPDVTVSGRARAVLGQTQGIASSNAGVLPSTDLADAGEDPERVLDLDLGAVLGQVEVSR